MPRRLTTEEFVKRAKDIHKDTYLYFNTVYTNSSTLVNIFCHIHGKVSVHPQSFLNGSGCKQCGRNTAKEKITYSTAEFISKAKLMFNYNYDEVDYINSSIKVKIICKSHGLFYQRPADHLTGHGCPECGIIKGTYSKIKNGNIIDPSLKDSFAAYTCEVWKYTRKSYRKDLIRIKNYHIARSYYWHLDHIFSIYDGYVNNINPKIIGHYSNLQIISRERNIRKNTTSWKTKEKLLEDYCK